VAAGTPSATKCIVCRHKRVGEIDAARAAGADELEIAQRFRLSKQALRKHAAHRAEEAAKPGKTLTEALLPSSDLAVASCRVCTHAKRADIEADIAGGGKYTTIGRRHQLDAGAVRAHAEGCLRGALRRPGTEAELRAVANARARCLKLVEQVEALIEQADSDEDISWRERAALITAAKGTLELLGRFTGEIGPAAELMIVESPKWKRIEATIAKALAPYPEAAAAVAKALEELEAA
jgi:hypothetical protein